MANRIAASIPCGSSIKGTRVRGYYSDYLRSPYWSACRRYMLWSADYRCERCGHPNQLQVHHRTYERLGCEWMPEDLEVLCDACHSAHHGKPAQARDYSGPEHISTILRDVLLQIPRRAA